MRKANRHLRKTNVRLRGTICLLLTVVSACSIVGPKSISAGRLQYAEAIDETEDQQMLLSIVKGRYGETSSLLAVSGIAANIRFSVRAGIEAGFSAGEAPLGDNLITGGMAFEENPTISYTPLQGEKYLRQILTPLPLDILIMSLRSSTFKGQILTFLVSRINNLSNPSFVNSASAATQGHFVKFVNLLTDLSNAGILDFSKSANDKSSYYLLIRASSSDYTQAISEFLSLLDLTVSKKDRDNIIIPIYFSEKPRDSWGIGITTRSMFDVLEILRASVQIPKDHIQAGITIDYPTIGLPGSDVHIRSSINTPRGALTAIKFRGYWFYISETDRLSKAAFSLLRSMWSIAITSSAGERNVPILTLPVNR